MSLFFAYGSELDRAKLLADTSAKSLAGSDADSAHQVRDVMMPPGNGDEGNKAAAIDSGHAAALKEPGILQDAVGEGPSSMSDWYCRFMFLAK